MKSVVDFVMFVVIHSAHGYSECRQQQDRQRLHDGSLWVIDFVTVTSLARVNVVANPDQRPFY